MSRCLRSLHMLLSNLNVGRIDLDANAAPPQLFGGNGGCTGADERVEYHIAGLCEQLDEPLRQLNGKCGAVTAIAALCGKVENI